MRGMKRYMRVMMPVRGMRTMMHVLEGDEIKNSNAIIRAVHTSSGGHAMQAESRSDAYAKVMVHLYEVSASRIFHDSLM